jgi:hypothetical protein
VTSLVVQSAIDETRPTARRITSQGHRRAALCVAEVPATEFVDVVCAVGCAALRNAHDVTDVDTGARYRRSARTPATSTSRSAACRSADRRRCTLPAMCAHEPAVADAVCHDYRRTFSDTAGTSGLPFASVGCVCRTICRMGVGTPAARFGVPSLSVGAARARADAVAEPEVACSWFARSPDVEGSWWSTAPGASSDALAARGRARSSTVRRARRRALVGARVGAASARRAAVDVAASG